MTVNAFSIRLSVTLSYPSNFWWNIASDFGEFEWNHTVDSKEPDEFSSSASTFPVSACGGTFVLETRGWELRRFARENRFGHRFEFTIKLSWAYLPPRTVMERNEQFSKKKNKSPEDLTRDGSDLKNVFTFYPFIACLSRRSHGTRVGFICICFFRVRTELRYFLNRDSPHVRREIRRRRQCD